MERRPKDKKMNELQLSDWMRRADQRRAELEKERLKRQQKAKQKKTQAGNLAS